MGLHRIQVPGPTGGFPVQDSVSYQGHVATAIEPPSPMTNGSHVLPGDAGGAVRFITERGLRRIRELRRGQLGGARGRGLTLDAKAGRDGG